jgi:hypothetical protein
MIPIKTMGIVLASFIWLAISIKQWAFDYPDLSNLIFAIGFFFVGLFVSYVLWYNTNNEEVKKDIQALDNKLNNLEVKLIELNGR